MLAILFRPQSMGWTNQDKMKWSANNFFFSFGELHSHIQGMYKMAIIVQTFLKAYLWKKCFVSQFRISLMFVPEVQIDNESALICVMAWYQKGNKPFAEPIITQFTVHMCVTRCSCVKNFSWRQHKPNIYLVYEIFSRHCRHVEEWHISKQDVEKYRFYWQANKKSIQTHPSIQCTNINHHGTSFFEFSLLFILNCI